MSALTAAAMWFCGLSAVTSNSRMIYAFARDQGLPLSTLWQSVSPKHLTPAPAIWVSIATAFLALIWSGAYSVVTSISTIALYFSYGMPVLLKILKRGSALWQRTPEWHLGRHTHWINAVAIGWTIFICGILVMPPNELSGKTMAGLTVALSVWFWASERHRYSGPRVATDTLIQAAEAKRDLA
jgi:amino acid transporter